MFSSTNELYLKVWVIMSLFVMWPYFYWTALPIKLALQHYTRHKPFICFIGALLLLAGVVACGLYSAVSISDNPDKNYQVVAEICFILFFVSLITNFVAGARALTFLERHALGKQSNAIVAFFAYFYLPIGIFFICPRIAKLYKSEFPNID